MNEDLISKESIKSPEEILADYESKRLEHISLINKFLQNGYVYKVRNQPSHIGYITILTSNNGKKIKEIHHSRPI